MVVGGEPLLLAAGGNRPQLERDLPGLIGGERELGGGGFEEQTAVGLEAIVFRGGQIVFAAAFEQDEMRLVAGGDFQRFGIAVLPPKFLIGRRAL
jgi:hypothetical protein